MQNSRPWQVQCYPPQCEQEHGASVLHQEQKLCPWRHHQKAWPRSPQPGEGGHQSLPAPQVLPGDPALRVHLPTHCRGIDPPFCGGLPANLENDHGFLFFNVNKYILC